MSDAIYRDPRLVLLYDILNPAGADTEFYLRRAMPGSRILDIGCGTGLLTRLFAAARHQVTGLDPATAMLDAARAKDGSSIVRWIEADAVDFSLDERFDLITMTGHVFQVFSVAESLRVLENAHRHLEDRGTLIFESRNPTARAWEKWTRESSARTFSAGSLGDVNMHHQVLSLDDGCVTFETVHHFLRSGEIVTSRSVLRFPAKDEIERQLLAAGFSHIEWLGGWEGQSWSPGEPRDHRQSDPLTRQASPNFTTFVLQAERHFRRTKDALSRFRVRISPT